MPRRRRHVYRGAPASRDTSFGGPVQGREAGTAAEQPGDSQSGDRLELLRHSRQAREGESLESQRLDRDRVSVQERFARLSRNLAEQKRLFRSTDVAAKKGASSLELSKHAEEEPSGLVDERHQSREEGSSRVHVGQFDAEARSDRSIDGLLEEGHRVELQLSAATRLRGKIDDEPSEADLATTRRQRSVQPLRRLADIGEFLEVQREFVEQRSEE